MPIYEYICQNCGATFDQLRTFSQADEPVSCPECSQTNSKRKLSSFFAHNECGQGSTSSHSCGSCSGGSCSNCHS